MIQIKEIIQSYLKGLESADTTAILELFSDEGEVCSPLYGRMPVSKFYQELFSDTQQSAITLLHIFQEVNKPDVVAAHFEYKWKMRNGSTSSFECVDVFYLNRQGKIKEMHIIYDTQHTRQDFRRLRPAP